MARITSLDLAPERIAIGDTKALVDKINSMQSKIEALATEANALADEVNANADSAATDALAAQQAVDVAPEEQNAAAAAALQALSLGQINQQRLDELRARVLEQGAVTLADRTVSNGWTTVDTQDTYVALAYPAENWPDYDVLLSVDADIDLGLVGELRAVDKQQNGFKIRCTGSAAGVVVRWTLLNNNR